MAVRGHGNGRGVRCRAEQQDRLPEQLGSPPSRGEWAAERIDEVEQRRDRGLDLISRFSPRVADEREQLTLSVYPLKEGGEPSEPSPHRRPGSGLDRPTAEQLDQVQDAAPEPRHPIADGRACDAVLPRHLRHGKPIAQARTQDSDHPHDRRGLARQRLARERALAVPAGQANPETSLEDLLAQRALEPCPRQLEIAPSAHRALAAGEERGGGRRDLGAVRGNVDPRYVDHVPRRPRRVGQTLSAVASIFRLRGPSRSNAGRIRRGAGCDSQRA